MRIKKMRKTNKFKKPEITNIYRVVRFDIGKETADTYLENALEKVLRDMDDDSIPYRFGFPVSVEELKICYNEKVGAYIVQFRCETGNEDALPEYARFTLQCDEERYAMLSDDDWRTIFTLVINEKNPDPKKFSKNVVTKLLETVRLK
jgi:hypothetical protein